MLGVSYPPLTGKALWQLVWRLNPHGLTSTRASGAEGTSASYGPEAYGPLSNADRLAHDLVNQVTAIGGLAQMGRLAATTHDKDGYLSRVESAAGHMAVMLRECLGSFAGDRRRPTCSRETRALVAESAGLVRPGFEAKGVSLVLSCEGQLPECRLDSVAVKRAIVNALDNALQATACGGGVEVMLRPCHEPPGLRLTVKDNGRGIPRHLLGQVCLPGFSTRSGGAGLGLVVIREAVELVHGGRFGLSSREGAGTTVHVFLPC